MGFSSAHSHRWFALQVRIRHEQVVADLLRFKGYEEFLPTYKRKRNGHCDIEEVPLFPGYLFCRFDPENRAPLVTTPGILRILGRGRQPLPVEEEEMEAIERIVHSGCYREPWSTLKQGSPVRIKRGPLTGLAGTFLTSKKYSRFVISISLLHRAVAVEMDSDSVEPGQVGP